MSMPTCSMRTDRLDYGRSPHAYVNQRQQRQLELLMMSGVPLETCWAVNEYWNNKFRYKVASCWLFIPSDIWYLYVLYEYVKLIAFFIHSCTIFMLQHSTAGPCLPVFVRERFSCDLPSRAVRRPFAVLVVLALSEYHLDYKVASFLKT
jgi:hypothetical protein